MLEKLLHFFPLLDTCSDTKKEQLIEHFRSAPDWVFRACTMSLIPSNTIFIREGDSLQDIYFIVDGSFKAIDYHIYGVEYDFASFTNNYAMGGMEVLMGIKAYRTTLKTTDRCLVLKISKDDFEKWMMQDVSALRYETKMMGEYLLEQGRLAREYLFLPGPERLMKVLVLKYEAKAENGVLRFHTTRQNLANETGFGIKTISRAIKHLTDNGLMKREDRLIEVTHQQYATMKEIVEKIVAPVTDEEAKEKNKEKRRNSEV